MANPYLPNWEYIPDSEPRIFGNRIYVYGSHDRKALSEFCDYRLKVWSAPLDNLYAWVCHGDLFRTRDGRDRKSDVSWTDKPLYAPDVVEKDGKYYLYAYIVDSKGCVAVADRPEGPFQLIGQYKYSDTDPVKDISIDGTFIDPGVLVDDDGKVYMYCGFMSSYVVEINPDNMIEILPESCQEHIIPKNPNEKSAFFEGCSIRKINNTYYLIYSPNQGSRLDYMTSENPKGPFVHRGTIINNGINFPAGNNHGSICNINGQWYIFYHRMTNGTVMARRSCVERINLLEDGSIPQVEMTSLGFEQSLSPYQKISADIACVLIGGCMVTEISPFQFCVSGITSGSIIGYKYFEFGEDYSSKTMRIMMDIAGRGCISEVDIYAEKHTPQDVYEYTTSDELTASNLPITWKKLGTIEIGTNDGIYSSTIKCITGYHALYFFARDISVGFFSCMLEGRELFALKEFMILK